MSRVLGVAAPEQIPIIAYVHDNPFLQFCILFPHSLAKEARLQGPSLMSITQRFYNYEYFKLARKQGTG